MNRDKFEAVYVIEWDFCSKLDGIDAMNFWRTRSKDLILQRGPNGSALFDQGCQMEVNSSHVLMEEDLERTRRLEYQDWPFDFAIQSLRYCKDKLMNQEERNDFYAAKSQNIWRRRFVIRHYVYRESWGEWFTRLFLPSFFSMDVIYHPRYTVIFENK